MGEDPLSKTRKEGRAAIQRLTLVLAPTLWCLGFLSSHFLMGCDVYLALLKATAYSLSGLGGWLVYVQIWKPIHPWFTPWQSLFVVNSSVLNQTQTPWPFREMLAHGLIVSILWVIICGPLLRWFERRRGIKLPLRLTNQS